MSKINIQDQLLYQARRERIPIKIFLLRGLQLIGRISAYDMYSVLLESQGRLQLIFKHAISTIEFPEKIKISAQEGEHGHHRSGGDRDHRDRVDRPPMGDRPERAPAAGDRPERPGPRTPSPQEARETESGVCRPESGAQAVGPRPPFLSIRTTATGRVRARCRLCISSAFAPQVGPPTWSII
jgi:host factor-I protein